MKKTKELLTKYQRWINGVKVVVVAKNLSEADLLFKKLINKK